MDGTTKPDFEVIMYDGDGSTLALKRELGHELVKVTVNQYDGAAEAEISLPLEGLFSVIYRFKEASR